MAKANNQILRKTAGCNQDHSAPTEDNGLKLVSVVKHDKDEDKSHKDVYMDEVVQHEKESDVKGENDEGELSQRESYELVLESAKRIEPFVNKTPVLSSTNINTISGLSLHFKCEMFQKTGSFKFRGAMYSLSKYAEEISQSNVVGSPVVVTHSSGNHGQAVALAAKMMDFKAYIVIPTTTPLVKKLAVAEYGATIVECQPSEQCRKQAADALVEEHSPLAKMITSYQSMEAIAAQGTAALELLQEVPNLDALLVPVGSGGLLAGSSMAAKGFNPNIKIYGVEPEAANDCALSFRNDRKITFPYYPQTIAEGLKVNMADKTWPIIRNNVDDIITVGENEIVRAMEVIWERMKVITEASGVVGFAAVLSDDFKSRGHKNVGIILSGGNVDFQNLPWIVKH